MILQVQFPYNEKCLFERLLLTRTFQEPLDLIIIGLCTNWESFSILTIMHAIMKMGFIFENVM